MSDEHELEMFIEDSSLSNGRQSAEQIHIAVDSSGMNVKMRRSAKGL